jgi:hypothetical protein
VQGPYIGLFGFFADHGSLQRDLNILIEKKIFEEKATSPTDPTKSYVLVESLFKN